MAAGLSAEPTFARPPPRSGRQGHPCV